MDYSHGRESIVPSKGIFGANKAGLLKNKAALLKIKAGLLMNNEGLLQKVVHLSRRMAQSPLNKGILPFSSLPSSLPDLSHNTPIDSPKGDGRDEGEIWEG